MDRLIDSAQLDGWIPARLHWSNGRPIVDWCYRSKHGIKSSSFDQIVQDCLHHPFNLLFRHQTPIEVLGQWNDARPGLKPTGFIFHMSRSGSTRVTRTLATRYQNLVLSEARPIDSILRAHFRCEQVTDEERILWLRWMVSALGQRWLGNEQQFIIKFDAWNISELPLIRRAFPNVPWVFIYGDPVEEMVSQLNHRGPHLVPGVIDPSLFGLKANAVAEMEPEEYCARVLAGICEAALAHHKNGGMLINKIDLPQAVWSTISPFFGVSCSESEWESLQGISKPEITDPALADQAKAGSRKEKEAARIREAAAKFLYPVYERLEAAKPSANYADYDPDS